MATKPSSVLITDRTISDVTNRTAKGFNNFSDVQRVQDWVNYFIDEVQPSLTKYTWTEYERVDKSKWETRILGNITELLKSYPDLSFTVPSAEAWDYQKQNQIESILLAMSKIEPIITTSFSEDSWETIINFANKKIAQKYYNVGDKKQEVLSNGDTAIFTVAAFDQFTINGTEEKANIMIDVEIKDKTYQMDESSSSSEHSTKSWANCMFRTETIPTILSSFSEYLRNNIKEILINTAQGVLSDYINENTVDKLFLYSIKDNENITSVRSINTEFWRRNWTELTVSPVPSPKYAFAFVYRHYNGAWQSARANENKKCPLIFNL